MKNLACLVLGVLVVTFALGFVTESAMAGEGMSTTAGNVKVLLDNDRVRVVEATRHPGTKVPMHTHPTYLAYFFGPWKGRFTSPEGKTSEKEFPAGKLLWFPKGKKHALEVIGTTDQHVLVIEIKK
ncbi:MAG: cupin domain-containing protein [Planctomycetota bacterium]|jgi:quercetin dioxygenase-like cupin family protein